jgi:uncharacterized protein (TIGR02217 family)
LGTYLVAPAIDSVLTFRWPIKKTPRFSTIEQMSSSGRGPLYISQYQWNLWDFEYTLGYLPGDATGTATVYQQVTNFFMAVQGRGAAFLFLDPYDHSVTNQNIGTGDGTTTEFAMYRTLLTSGGAADLIQNFVSAPTIYVDSVAKTVTTDYSIDPYGQLTFVTAPASGKAITWTGEFYFLCRFSKDSFDDMEEQMYQIWGIKTFKFSSVLN